MRITASIILLGTLALGGCGASSGLTGDDEILRYWQRADTVTLSAGDAQPVNRATQVNHPWPRYVRDRRIPVDGERMAGAVGRYRRPPQETGGPGAAAIGAAAGAGAAVGAAAAAGASR